MYNMCYCCVWIHTFNMSNFVHIYHNEIWRQEEEKQEEEEHKEKEKTRLVDVDIIIKMIHQMAERER